MDPLAAYGLEPRNAAWDDLKAQLAERILAHAETDGTDALEEECWSLLHPLVEPILPESHPSALQLLAQPIAALSGSVPPGMARIICR